MNGDVKWPYGFTSRGDGVDAYGFTTSGGTWGDPIFLWEKIAPPLPLLETLILVVSSLGVTEDGRANQGDVSRVRD